MAAFNENEMKDFKITDWYDLSGQVAVVTGGSTGLGLAITRWKKEFSRMRWKSM